MGVWFVSAVGLTVLIWGWAIARINDETKGRSGDYAVIGDAMVLLFYGGVATILTLIVWIIYLISRILGV